MSEESSELYCIGEECEGCMECVPFHLNEEVKKWTEYTEEDRFWRKVAMDWLAMEIDTIYLMECGKNVIDTIQRLRDGEV